MFAVQGALAMFLGGAAYPWIPGFPEDAARTWKFLTPAEAELILARIDEDRGDAGAPEPCTAAAVLYPFLDPKLYAFSILFFLQNVVSTALSYFILTILLGLGFDPAPSILLYAPPYCYAVIPAIATSLAADRLATRGPVIAFNALCLVASVAMLGFSDRVAVRYAGVMLATGAYVSNGPGWTRTRPTTSRASGSAPPSRPPCPRATRSAASRARTCSRRARRRGTVRYGTAIWIGIGSHVSMIAIVAVCNGFFWRANRRAGEGKGVIESVEGFRYTY